MRGLDLDQLRTFVAVCDAGSLSAAAPRLFLAPSSVSEQLSTLEARLGLALLTRGKKGALPTAAGAKLLEHARALLALSEHAVRDVTGQTLEGALTLAVSDYYRPAEIAHWLAHLRDRYPRLHLRLVVASSAAIDAAAGAAAFDIGVTMRIVGAAPERPRSGQVLRRESLAWVTSHAADRGVERPLPLVALPETCSLHGYTVRLLRRQRVPFVWAHSASGVAGLQLSIAAGLGVACLNESSIVRGMARCSAACELPKLPRVEFVLLGPRRGEPALTSQVREVLRALF